MNDYQNPETVKTIVDKINTVLHSHYVYPEKAENMAENLKKHLESGDYLGVQSTAELAELLQSHLYEIVVDKHNKVLARDEKNQRMFDMADRVAEIEKKEMEEMQKDTSGGVRRIVKVAGPGEGPKMRKMAMSKGEFKTGIAEVKVLDNNIGYINLEMFNSPHSPDGDKMRETLDKMADTNALIMDLRQCRGGNGEMVHLVQDFLLGITEGEEIQIIEHYFRPHDHTLKRFARVYDGRTYRGKPVYILTSNLTGSAAEDITFSLRNLKRATVVGETTGGAGHPTSFHKITDDLLFMCAIGRAYDPITKKGWEGTGVDPNVKVDADRALEKTLGLISGS